jgi:hypothetical protein
MPQASDELTEEIARICGDASDHAVVAFLEQRGWTLDREWQWHKSGQTYQTMPQDEYLAVLFMIDEWDYGGVVDDPPAPSQNREG